TPSPASGHDKAISWAGELFDGGTDPGRLLGAGLQDRSPDQPRWNISIDAAQCRDLVGDSGDPEARRAAWCRPGSLVQRSPGTRFIDTQHLEKPAVSEPALEESDESLLVGHDVPADSVAGATPRGRHGPQER